MVAGGRVLHVALESGISIQDRVAIDGYTLIVTNSNVTEVCVTNGVWVCVSHPLFCFFTSGRGFPC